MNNEKQGFRAAILAAICAFLISFGAVFCPVSAFGLSVNSWALLLVCLAASMICAVVFTVFRPGYGFGAAGLTLAAFGWFFHGKILASAAGLLAGIGVHFTTAFNVSMPQVLTDALESGADATMALGILASFLALLTAWTVISRCSLAGVFLASAPFLVVCLVILQTEPTTLPMLTLTGAWTLLILTQKLRYDTTQSGHRLALHLLVPVAVLIAALALIFPRNGYERSEWSQCLSPMVSQAAEKLTVFRKNAATGQMEFVSPFTPSTLGRWPWDSSVSNVNLKRVGPQKKTGRRVMQVRSELTAISHLRADSLAVYEDSTWRALDERDYEGSGVSEGVLLSPSAAALGLSSGNMLDIRTDMKSSIFYTPYRPLELPAGGEAVFDAYIKNPSQLTEYSVPYAYVEETADRNAQYEAFVQKTYTQLPDDIRPELETILEEAEIDRSDTWLTARDITVYVARSARYSLDTPRVPDGEDFALWFLRESDTGYCVHFATATALLLRAAGIPARYVTGYYFRTLAGQWVDVSEDDAHAWVEYYLDGYGWQVLDPTPAETGASAPEEQPEETPQPSEEQQTPAQQTKPEQPQDADTSQPSTPTQDEDQSAPEAGGGKTVLRVVWGLLAIALVLALWQVALTALRHAAMQTGSSNKRAIAYWHHIDFLCKLDQSEPPEQLRELALKARFSQHKLSASDLGSLQACSDKQTQRLLTKSSRLKTLFLRSILALRMPPKL